MATQLDADGNTQVTNEQDNATEAQETPKLINAEQFDQIDKLFEESQAEHLAPADEVKTEDKTQATDANAQVDAQIEAVGLIDDPAKHKVKVKLEGQEAEIPLSEVLAGYQKNEVASRRLNEATRIKAEAEALLAKAKSGQVATDEPTNTDKPTQKVDEDAVKLAKTAINGILDGNEEEAAQALAQLTGRGNSTQESKLDANEIAAAVKQQLDVESALNEFSTAYQDVLADPHLARMTNEALTAELNSGTHADYASALKAAGDATRDWMQKMGLSTQQDKVTTTTDERVARKKAVEQTPQVNASVALKNEPEENPLSIVEEMKKERGFIT